MTQPGETAGYAWPIICAPSRSTFRAGSSIGSSPTARRLSPEVARRYRAQGAEPVAVDISALQKLGFRVILDNLLEEHGVIRHHTKRLSRLLLEEFLHR